MASTASSRRRQPGSFRIHEDVRPAHDTRMDDRVVANALGAESPDDAAGQEDVDYHQPSDEGETDSSDEDIVVDDNVQWDMQQLQGSLPDFQNRFRLIKRIGEGTFSTVYKAEDLQYDQFDNSWDVDKENDGWSAPALKRHAFSGSSSATPDVTGTQTPSSHDHRRRRPKFVAIKKIYVTSSPTRILNELELLYVLRGCRSVCPLITAFRHTDQVFAVLPYFRHADFRDYFRSMTVADTAIYLRALFTALSAVHARGILHRDIKPTNFLYDPLAQRGVLVDFGLAEREGVDTKPCPCHDDPSVRKRRQQIAIAAATATNPAAAAAAAATTNSLPGPPPVRAYPKHDTRPSRRANRAGTRGFRAPEVLFKCTNQTTKIDVWSVGVILLTILSRRFPFFNSADDVEATIELATVFGQRKMKAAALLHGCAFETDIPTVGTGGFQLERIIAWSTCRDKPSGGSSKASSGSGDAKGGNHTGQTSNGSATDFRSVLDEDELQAIEFLYRCLDLDASRRISAADALEHDFLSLDGGGTVEGMDITPVEGEGEDGAHAVKI